MSISKSNSHLSKGFHFNLWRITRKLSKHFVLILCYLMEISCFQTKLDKENYYSNFNLEEQIAKI